MKKIEFSNILYFIKSGLEGAKFNSAMTAASLIIMVAGLCIFGIYSVISDNINFLGMQISAGYSVSAFLEKGTPPERAYEIQEEIKQNNAVKDVSYTSEEEALAKCREMFGKSADFLVGLEEENPLRSSLEITMYDISDSQKTAEMAEGITDVARVKNDVASVEKIRHFTGELQKYSLILTGIFVLLDIFIISNTIRITIISRKNEIYIMRYLGASNSFIKMPFAAEGLTIGFAGAVFSSIIVLSGYALVCAGIGGHIGEGMRLYYPGEIALDLCLKFAVIGLGMGIISTIIPMVKYLKA